MKNACQILLCSMILFLGACSREDEVPMEDHEPEPPEEPIQNRPSRSICDFDLTPVEGNFSLFGKWEFIGFQHLETGALGNADQTTCSARIAYYSLHEANTGEEDFFEILLTFYENTFEGEGESCQNRPQLEALGFETALKSCFMADEDGGISIEVEDEYYLYYHAIIFPYHDFNNKYFQALSNATHYEIESNQLYIYFGSEEYRLTYLAVESEES